MGLVTGLLASLLLQAAAPLSAQEVIVAIQVHGNTLTPDAEIVRASGLSEGNPFSESVLSDAEARLRAFKRFYQVDVLKRYASITDPSQVLVVIQVDEGPVRIDSGGIPGLPGQSPTVVRRRRFNMMAVPLLDAEDGYGLTYGGLVAFTGYRNTTRRVIVPLTWGGDKRASAEFQKEWSRRFAPDIRAGALVQRRRHPFFDSNADRKRVWGRAEWQLAQSVRAGSEAAWQESRLIGERTKSQSIGADLTLDTRIDPLMPYNAIYARAAVDRLKFSSGSTLKSELEANGYIGLYRGTVLALRALREDVSRPVPAYFKSMLGGSSTLRGFQPGDSIGDTLVAGSAELRIPLNSPLRVARFGTSVFMDVGTAYDKGQHFGDQQLKRGVGAGIWATASLFRITLMVAHGVDAGNRVHFGAGLTF